MIRMKTTLYISGLLATLVFTACGNKKESNKIVMENNASVEPKNVTVNPPSNFFTASGKDYSYHMEIDFNGTISFIGTTPSLAINIKETLPEAFESNLGKGFMYTVNGQNDLKLTVHVFDETCDGTKKKSKIIVADKTGEVVIDESTCGVYHSGVNLGGVWLLHEVNGMNAVEYLKNEQLPRMEMNVQGNAFYGTFGCRTFAGNYDVIEQKLFTAIRQAPNLECIESPEESEFIKIFGDQEFNFQFKNNYLIWKNEGNEIIFKRID